MTHKPEPHYSELRDELDRRDEIINSYKKLLADERAEVERLNQCVTWEQHRSGRIGTHSTDCHTWGPQHYECLLRKFEMAALSALGEPET
jgi:hypothetical protein